MSYLSLFSKYPFLEAKIQVQCSIDLPDSSKTSVASPIRFHGLYFRCSWRLLLNPPSESRKEQSKNKNKAFDFGHKNFHLSSSTSQRLACLPSHSVTLSCLISYPQWTPTPRKRSCCQSARFLLRKHPCWRPSLHCRIRATGSFSLFNPPRLLGSNHSKPQRVLSANVRPNKKAERVQLVVSNPQAFRSSPSFR